MFQTFHLYVAELGSIRAYLILFLYNPIYKHCLVTIMYYKMQKCVAKHLDRKRAKATEIDRSFE